MKKQNLVVMMVLSVVIIGVCLGFAIPAYPIEVYYQIGTTQIQLCENGREIPNPFIGLNLSGGSVFVGDSKQLSLDVSISGYPIANRERFFYRNRWEEYLGIGATLYLSDEVSFNGNCTEDQISLGVNAHIEWLDLSVRASWDPNNISEDRQDIGIKVNTSTADGSLAMAFSTDWNFEDCSILMGASMELSFSGTFSTDLR